MTAQRDLRRQVASLLLELTPVQMRVLRAEARDCRGTLTIPQFRMLVNLSQEPLNNKGLAALLGVSVPAASRMAESLVKAGFVKKATPASGDKRNVVLSLTEAGRRKVQETRDHVRERFEQQLTQVPDGELLGVESGLRSLQKFFTASARG